MPPLTIADLLAHRVTLHEKEAAALTLAVARTLDRHRESGCAVSVPDDGAIALHRDGHLTFLGVARTSAVDDVTALSSLLLRLLSAADPDRARPPVLPRDTALALRAMLLDMSCDDPAVLVAVYWRAASAMRRRSRRHAVRSERRRQHPPATELRRCIRHLEHQLFAERVRGLRGRWTQRRTRRVAWLGWIAAAGACALMAASVTAWAYRPGAAHASSQAAHVDRIAVALASSAPAASAPPVRDVATRHRRPTALIRVRQQHTRAVLTSARRTARPQTPVMFPWGTRTAPWSVGAR